MRGTPINAPMTGMAVTCSGRGYYMVAADGGVFTFGDAHFRGSLAATPVASPILCDCRELQHGGYWLLARDGGVFTFGNAGFYGSLGGAHLASPIVGMLPTHDIARLLVDRRQRKEVPIRRRPQLKALELTVRAIRGATHTETCFSLLVVKGERSQSAHRSRSCSPAIWAIRSRSAGQPYAPGKSMRS